MEKPLSVTVEAKTAHVEPVATDTAHQEAPYMARDLDMEMTERRRSGVLAERNGRERTVEASTKSDSFTATSTSELQTA